MNKLPYEILCKISGYYPSPELTPTRYCNMNKAVNDRIVNKFVDKLIQDMINDILNDL